MEFGYWGLKGRGEPIRWLLSYLNLHYTEFNPKDFAEWFKIKPTLSPFANLPYIKDGGFFLTESTAIYEYLCTKANRPELLGVGAQQIARRRQLQSVIDDLLQGNAKVFSGQSVEERSMLFEDVFAEGKPLDQKVSLISEFLGEKNSLLANLLSST